MIRGAKYFLKFDEAPFLLREEGTHGTSNFTKLLLGRLDTVIMNESGGLTLLHDMKAAGKIDTAEYRPESAGTRDVARTDPSGRAIFF